MGSALAGRARRHRLHRRGPRPVDRRRRSRPGRGRRVHPSRAASSRHPPRRRARRSTRAWTWSPPTASTSCTSPLPMTCTPSSPWPPSRPASTSSARSRWPPTGRRRVPDVRAGASAAGCLGAVPFVNRFHPMAREARALVAGGSCGAVHTVHGSYLQDWLLDPDATNWRVDAVRGGPSRAFADIGSHWVDLAEWITGDRIVELVATTSINVADRPSVDRETFSTEPPGSDAGSRADHRPRTRLACSFAPAAGPAGTLTVSQVAAGRKNRLWIEIDAEHNSVTFDQEDAEHLRIGDGIGARPCARDPNQLSSAAQPYAVLPAGHAQGFQDCFDAFVRDVYRSIDDGAPREGLPHVRRRAPFRPGRRGRPGLGPSALVDRGLTCNSASSPHVCPAHRSTRSRNGRPDNGFAALELAVWPARRRPRLRGQPSRRGPLRAGRRRRGQRTHAAARARHQRARLLREQPASRPRGAGRRGRRTSAVASTPQQLLGVANVGTFIGRDWTRPVQENLREPRRSCPGWSTTPVSAA